MAIPRITTNVGFDDYQLRQIQQGPDSKIVADKEFRTWFYSASHRTKYPDDHPAYLAAHEAWMEQQARFTNSIPR